MDNSTNCNNDNINNSYFNLSVDKDQEMNNIDLFDLRPNFDFNCNKPVDKNINANYIFEFSSKTNMNLKEKKEEEIKGEINQIKDDKTNFTNYPIDKKEKINEKKICLLGRKKREDSGSGDHNKFCDDNLRRKCKHLVLDSTLNFINDKIYEKFEGNIGYGIFVKKLLIINQKQKSDASIQYNKNFLKKTLGEIFSEEISSRYTSHHPLHNYFLIKALTSDKNEERQNYFKKLFRITFIDCLNHFIGIKMIEELKGLDTFENIKTKYKDDTDYLKSLRYCTMNYEDIINNKRARTRKRKENKIAKKSSQKIIKNIN